MMEVPCEWCNKNIAQYELAIYPLKEIDTFKRSQQVDQPTRIEYKTLGRGTLYCSIKLCKNCLPTTKVQETTIPDPISYRVLRRPIVDDERK